MPKTIARAFNRMAKTYPRRYGKYHNALDELGSVEGDAYKTVHKFDQYHNADREAGRQLSDLALERWLGDRVGGVVKADKTAQSVDKIRKILDNFKLPTE